MNILLLFSSNIRPLYEQDILDVLAAPEGSRYNFRYESRYVHASALDQWDRLESTPALVLFSIQQEAYYQEPAYIPVRRASVIRARIEGDLCFVEFTLGPIVSLPKARTTTSGSHYDEAVVRLSEEVNALPSPGRTSRKSASLVDDRSLPIIEVDTTPVYTTDGALLFQAKDQVDAFKTSVEYLSRTSSFRSSNFITFYQLTDRKSREQVKVVDGAFRLEERSDFELELLQMQPRQVTSRTQFSLGSADELVQIIGARDFDIASRYDLIRIPLHVPPLAGENRETILAIGPKLSDTSGPRIRLRLVLTRRPNTASAAGAASLLLLAGLPGSFPSVPRIAIVLVGASIAFAFFYYGWLRVASPRP